MAIDPGAVQTILVTAVGAVLAFALTRRGATAERRQEARSKLLKMVYSFRLPGTWDDVSACMDLDEFAATFASMRSLADVCAGKAPELVSKLQDTTMALTMLTNDLTGTAVLNEETGTLIPDSARLAEWELAKAKAVTSSQDLRDQLRRKLGSRTA